MPPSLINEASNKGGNEEGNEAGHKAKPGETGHLQRQVDDSTRECNCRAQKCSQASKQASLPCSAPRPNRSSTLPATPFRGSGSNLTPG